jgi:hypothetical protein
MPRAGLGKGSALLKAVAPLVVFAAAALLDGFSVTIPQQGFCLLPPCHICQAPTTLFASELTLPFLAASLASAIRTIGASKSCTKPWERRARSGPRRCEQRCRGHGALRIGRIDRCCVALNSIPAEKAAETGNPRIAWLVAFLLCLLGFFPVYSA